MRVAIAGSNGLVGSSLVRKFESQEFEVVPISRSNLDLLDLNATMDFISEQNLDIVVDAAARVGGIGANSREPVEFLLDNLRIQNNLMQAAHHAKVRKFVFLGSSCIYPRSCPQPMREEYLMSGELENSNSAYAIAKIAGLELVKAYRKEYGMKWISVMPSNLYGPNDNFNLENSHVLPALMRKFVEATSLGSDSITLWGTGSPRREFLHVDDFASAVLTLIEKYDMDLPINVGFGKDLRIQELANLVAEVTGFQGTINWDNSKPDGTPRKLLDISRITQLGWKPRIEIRSGIVSTIEWYKRAVSEGVARV